MDESIFDPEDGLDRSYDDDDGETFSELDEVDDNFVGVTMTDAAALDKALPAEFVKLVKAKPSVFGTETTIDPADDFGGPALHGIEKITEKQKNAAAFNGPGTDDHAARRMVERFGYLFNYCPEIDAFHVWDGRRWHEQKKDGPLMIRIALASADTYWADVAGAKDQEMAVRAARAVHSLKSLRNACQLAPSISDISKALDKYDRGITLANFLNGTVDMSKPAVSPEHFYPHRKEDRITRLTLHKYRPGARHQKWEDYQDSTFGPYKDREPFMRRVAGLMLSGDTSPQKWFLQLGEGEQGKSTFGKAIRTAAGTDYATDVRAAMITKTKFADKTDPDLADCRGKRAGILDETPRGTAIADARIKRLADTGMIPFVAKYKDKSSYRNEMTLLASSNYPLTTDDTSHGFYRRAVIIPYLKDHVIVNKNERLDAELAEESCIEAILAYCVEGYYDFFTNGLQVPEDCEQALEDFKASQHPLAAWLEDAATLDPDATMDYRDLKESINGWIRCRRADHDYGPFPKTSDMALPPLLKSLSPSIWDDRDSKTGRKQWHGIRVRYADAEDQEELDRLITEETKAEYGRILQATERLDASLVDFTPNKWAADIDTSLVDLTPNAWAA